jgi:hypothetical protein
MPDQVMGPAGEVAEITDGSRVDATLGELLAEPQRPEDVPRQDVHRRK